MNAFAVLFEASLIGWGWPAVQISRPSFYEAVPIAVLAQIVPVMCLLFSTGSEHRDVEKLAAIPLWVLRLSSAAISAALVGTTAIASSLAIGKTGTLQVLAPAFAFVGMYGIGLCASTLVDRRLAGLFSLVPIVAPMAFSPTIYEAAPVWSFIIPGDTTGSPNYFALLWCLVGIAMRGLVRREG